MNHWKYHIAFLADMVRNAAGFAVFWAICFALFYLVPEYIIQAIERVAQGG